MLNQEMLWGALIADMGVKETREEELFKMLTEVLNATGVELNDLFYAKYSSIAGACYVKTFPDFEDEGLRFYLPNTSKADSRILCDIILKQGI